MQWKIPIETLDIDSYAMLLSGALDGNVRKWSMFYFWKYGLVLLTLYGDSIHKPANLGFGFSTDSTSQDACLIWGEDQVPGSTDPERGRWG